MDKELRVGSKVRVIGKTGYTNDTYPYDIIRNVEKEEGFETLYYLYGVSGPSFYKEDLELYIEPEEKEDKEVEVKKLNLCDLLRGHEGEICYTPLCGDIKLVKIHIDQEEIQFQGCSPLTCTKEGYLSTSGEPTCLIYPSRALYEKYPLDAYSAWMEWYTEQQNKTPKTWSEFTKERDRFEKLDYCIDLEGNKGSGWTRRNTSAEKAALALLKINTLIEIGYGGNIKEEEWNVLEEIYCIEFDADTSDFIVTNPVYHYKNHLAFRTEMLAKEFLSHSENIKLLKDYHLVKI